VVLTGERPTGGSPSEEVAVDLRPHDHPLRLVVGTLDTPGHGNARPSHRYAVVDVGTNSVKLLVAERDAKGRWQTVVDRSEITRLGEGLAARGTIGRKGVARTAAAIDEMLAEARQKDVVGVAAVGTAGLRLASNRDEVLAEIAARTGTWIEIIAGQEESRLGFLGVETAIGDGRETLVVVDTGGGSSQFTFGHGREVDEQFSLNVGAVRYTERFGLSRRVSRKTLRAACAALAVDLASLEGRRTADDVVAMGGAATNLASVMLGLPTYDRDLVDGAVLDAREVDRQIELYRRANVTGRRATVGLQPKRAEVILAGACIVRTVMTKLGRDSVTVTSRGLRHGVMVDRFGTASLAAEPWSPIGGSRVQADETDDAVAIAASG